MGLFHSAILIFDEPLCSFFFVLWGWVKQMLIPQWNISPLLKLEWDITECKIRNHPSHNSCARNGLPGKQIAEGWVMWMRGTRGALQGVLIFWCFLSCDINLIFFFCTESSWMSHISLIQVVKIPSSCSSTLSFLLFIKVVWLFHAMEKEVIHIRNQELSWLWGADRTVSTWLLQQVQDQAMTLDFYRNPHVQMPTRPNR